MDETGMALFGSAIIVAILFIGLPWLIFHYITRWKSQATLTNEDEKLLDELHDLARRLDDRMWSVGRIMSAENPNWRSVACDPIATGIENLSVANNPRRIGQ